ncbi:MAG TPA: hypothetical protein VMS17_18700 [Gemmataceae bacterium]|nr:hypothetical protein [Gemmataceae bacterium]
MTLRFSLVQHPLQWLVCQRFPPFLRIGLIAIAKLLESNIDDRTDRRRDAAQLRDTNSLIRLGGVHLDFKRQQPAERGQAAQQLIQHDPDFVVPLRDGDDELSGARRQYPAG